MRRRNSNTQMTVDTGLEAFVESIEKSENTLIRLEQQRLEFQQCVHSYRLRDRAQKRTEWLEAEEHSWSSP